MKIIIIKPDTTICEFNCYSKRWAGNFLKDPVVFSDNKESINTFIDKALNELALNDLRGEVIEHTFIKDKKDNKLELFDFDLVPDSDYGLTLFDFNKRVVISSNQYSNPSEIMSAEINSLLSPNYIVQDKPDLLNKYRELIDQDMFTYTLEDGTKANYSESQKFKNEMIKRIDDFLTNTNKVNDNGLNLNFFYHKNFTIDKGWTNTFMVSDFDTEVTSRAISLFIDYGFVLNKKSFKKIADAFLEYDEELTRKEFNRDSNISQIKEQLNICYEKIKLDKVLVNKKTKSNNLKM